MKRFSFVFLGVLIGFAVGLAVDHHSAMAQSSGWGKDEVIPVVFVEYSYGGFVPVSSHSAARWNKEQVVPMCSVKPSYGRFVPTDSSYGQGWERSEVKPYVLVKDAYGHFIPAN